MNRNFVIAMNLQGLLKEESQETKTKVLGKLSMADMVPESVNKVKDNVFLFFAKGNKLEVEV